MAFGVTSAGFVAMTTDDIKADLEAGLRAVFGESIDLSPASNFGQFVGLMTERIQDAWAMGEDVYSSFDPDSATGAALDALAGITGTTREPATPSTVELTLVGTTGVIVPEGSVASVEVVGTRFATLEDATIAAATAWVNSTAYALGAIRTNSGKVYRVITAGTSAGSGGPTTTADDITDGTVHWEHLGTGDGYVQVDAEAEETGPLSGTAGTISVIETPVANWNAVTNFLDADLGTDIETDAALRIRREEELASGGTSPVDAIRSAVLDVEDVTSCTVFENVTDATDSNSIPPHAIRVLVEDGDDTDIAEAIFANKAAGIATDGTTTVAVEDSKGISHDIKFSRPTEVNVYVALTLTYDADLYPSDGDAQVKAAIVAFGDAQKTGKNVVASGVGAQAFSVAGVLDVTPVYIGTAPSPVSSTAIPISLFELAKFDTSRITVTSSSATP
jgi:uncharacterized phage protein gp47/JayE